MFKDHINTGEVSVYLDDFLIMTQTVKHHFKVLEEVFKLLVANCLELRFDKCRFLETKLEYLGYTITDEGIRPTNRDLEAIQKFSTPRNMRVYKAS